MHIAFFAGCSAEYDRRQGLSLINVERDCSTETGQHHQKRIGEVCLGTIRAHAFPEYDYLKPQACRYEHHSSDEHSSKDDQRIDVWATI